jgi:acyl-CoA hydrolase
MGETRELLSELCRRVPPGGRVAVSDGAGFPDTAWPAVLEFAHQRPDAKVLLGWCFSTPEGLDDLPRGQVFTVFSGYGMRRVVGSGSVGFIPARFGTLPGLMRTALRPDVLVATVRPGAGGFHFTTEIAWMRAAVQAGADILAVVNRDGPVIDTGDPLPGERVVVIGENALPPLDLKGADPTDVHRAIADRVVERIPEGARMQVGPGGLGCAVYAAVNRPVQIDTGLITDPVVELDSRGLLVGRPIAPYATGTAQLYDWAPGRVVLAGLETTHHPNRLRGGPPLVAVNTCLQLDLDGQAGAEAVGGAWVGGVGGQPDYAAAAAASTHGLSIMALPCRTRGVPTLVKQLDGPVTTPGHDIDVVVTDTGQADLRGLSRPERRAALRRLWGSDAA